MPNNKKEKPAGPNRLQSVKGMHDVLPEQVAIFEKICKNAKDLLDFYNFQRITTPIVERLDLYARTTGETSDIVEKQMFTLKTRSSETFALRPEFTPGIARSYIQNNMDQLSHPVKLFSIGPLFRYEQPQAGRLRQFNQINAEIFSVENDPIYDAQIILAGYQILNDLKIKDIIISINSIGCKNCRPNYRKALINYYKSREKQLCEDCKRRLPTNPLRLLDCKSEQCQPFKERAPITVEYLCGPCKKHFKEVLDYLDHLKLPYMLNNFLVRGLDYYSKTVFEFITETSETEKKISFALGGGGRYDYLVDELGGKPTPAVGLALGIERIIEVLRHRNLIPTNRPKGKVFLVHIGELAKKQSLCLVELLRMAHIGVIESLGKESLAAQLRVADRVGSPLALIYGQKEAHEDSVLVRDMKTGAQETIPIAKLPEMIKKRLG